MTNPCAPNSTQDIKPFSPLLSLFGVHSKNPFPPLQALVISALLTECFSRMLDSLPMQNAINQLEILL